MLRPGPPPAPEILALAELLAEAGGLYATHMRTEGDAILDAMGEAFAIGLESRVPVIISHLKCAGVDNWGRSREVLERLDAALAGQTVNCDCYPYAASSSTLDLGQVDERVKIVITWSTPYPAMGGSRFEKSLRAGLWRKSKRRESCSPLEPSTTGCRKRTCGEFFAIPRP